MLWGWDFFINFYIFIIHDRDGLKKKKGMLEERR